MEIGDLQARGNAAVGRGASAARPEKLADASSQADGGLSETLDPVDLTDEAAALVEADAGPGRGRSDQSPAHRARALIAQYPHLSSLPFGQVVSGLLHDSLDLNPPAEATPAGEADEGEPVLETDPGLPPPPEAEPEGEPALVAAPSPDGESALASILADALAGEDDGRVQPAEI